MKNLILMLCFGLFSVVAGVAHAEEQKRSESQAKPGSPEVFATVNGAPLSMNLYRFLLGSREQESQERQAHDDGFDAELHRQQTADDLIMTELLAQQATRRGMHDSERVRAEMAMAEKTLLAQLYVQHLMHNLKVDEAEIRHYYDQQSDHVMYRFLIWQAPSQARATAILKALEAGHDAGAGAQDVIETPWLRDTDIAPDVNEIVRRLEVNDFAEQPIFQDGVWKVVQVIDKQVMTKQSYEESREIIKAELVRLKLDEKLEALAEEASIVLNDQLLTQPAN